MESSSSKVDEDSHLFESNDNGEDDEVKSREAGPRYSDDAWIVSCRSRNSLDSFSNRLLMYQPDMRNFCPKGKYCYMYRNGDEVHNALYIHQQKPSSTSKSTVIANPSSRRMAKPASIPSVSRAWILGRKRAKIDGIPTNSTVVMFVHGFSETYTRIISYLNHLEGTLPDIFQQSKVIRMGFVWPSSSVSYFRARFASEVAAKFLRRTLRILLDHGNKLVLVCHSMGCRVALHTLYNWANAQVEHLFLIGAGVASDILNKRQQYDARYVSAKQITVLHSKRDDLLEANFKFAEFLPGMLNWRPIAATVALGARGIPQGSTIDPKVDSLDCSTEVFGHSTHFYLNSSIALEAMRKGIQKTIDQNQNQNAPIETHSKL